MTNIYDEAIEEIKNAWNGNPLTYPKKTIEALERAKKEHELLGLYRKRIEGIENVAYKYDIQKQINIKEKELEDIK